MEKHRGTHDQSIHQDSACGIQETCMKRYSFFLLGENLHIVCGYSLKHTDNEKCMIFLEFLIKNLT